MAACCLLFAPAPAVASERAELRDVFREWKVALRERNPDACVLMTRRMRRILHRAYDPYFNAANCRELVELEGGTIRHDVAGAIDEIRVTGRRAWIGFARTDGGVWALRTRGEWYLHIPPVSEQDRYPGGPTA